MPLEIVDDYSQSAFARAQTGLLFNLPPPPAGKVQLPAGISLCMIVKDEERFLERCLRSVRGCVDEINVVDTGSTDGTIAIAESFGAKISRRPWRNDFAWARNQALAMATKRWTLVLDADEELAPESAPLLAALAHTPADLATLYVQIQNAIDDESGAATMSHYVVRLFPNTPRLRYRNVIHENVCLDDGAVPLVSLPTPVRVVHHGYTRTILADRQKDDRNRPLLERAIREEAEEPFSWFNYGVSAIAAGDIDDGIAALERMFALSPQERSFFPIAYVMLASAYGEHKGEIAHALELIDRGLALAPTNPNLIFTRGYLLSLERRYAEARTWYERAADLPRSLNEHFMVDDEIPLWKAAFNLAATYVREGDDERASGWYERALVAKPDSALLRDACARSCERAGRTYDAERLFREAAERDGATGRASLVNFLLRRRRFVEAFDLIDRAHEPMPPRVLAGLLLSAAVALQDEGLGDPEPYARRALALAPGHGLVLRFLDELYEERNEIGLRETLRSAELDAPLDEAPDFARRSHRLLEEQLAYEAFAIARRGLELAPRDPVLRYNAALAASRCGRDDDARALLDGLTGGERDPQFAPAALTLRVEIERRAGDLDAALRVLERLTLLPRRDDPALRRAVVDVAAALVAAGRLDDAGALASRALA